MLTTQISGRPIGHSGQPDSTKRILTNAGRDLARIHQIEVRGFGWIKRDTDDEFLRAEYPTLSTWLDEHFVVPIRELSHASLLSDVTVTRLLEVVTLAKRRFEVEAAVLGHGDFDATHIYYDQNEYSGIIDFGEIRGVHRMYDLGHFSIENGHLLEYLLAGYAEVVSLPHDASRDILISGLLIAARRVSRRLLQKRKPHPPDLLFIERTLQKIGNG